MGKERRNIKRRMERKKGLYFIGITFYKVNIIIFSVQIDYFK